jgi:SAM-dependent methyltransferase
VADKDPTEDLRSRLRALYAAEVTVNTWSDPADHSYLCVHLIERSIAGLALRLRGRMIDVGCGRQPYRASFAHLTEIVACDFDGARGTVDFTCPADRIPVEAESFDSVLCTEVLEHVPDPSAVWREFFRILRPGGRVLLTTPMYWPAHEEPYDFWRFTRCGLRRVAEEAGFRVEELWPRGGSWALLAQVGLQTAGHYLRWPSMRRIYNAWALRLDAARNNPSTTMGWTILAAKPEAASA